MWGVKEFKSIDPFNNAPAHAVSQSKQMIRVLLAHGHFSSGSTNLTPLEEQLLVIMASDPVRDILCISIVQCCAVVYNPREGNK